MSANADPRSCSAVRSPIEIPGVGDSFEDRLREAQPGGLPTNVKLGFDSRTNKVMKIGQDLKVRVLGWLVIVLIYEVIEQRSRTRRWRSALYEGRGPRRRRRP